MKPGVVFVLCFWFLLFWAGFPLPNGDDLFFSGAAINMTQGGTFSNPYCPGLVFLGARDHFFVYMPFHSYALAGWLTLFGVSRLALIGFQCLAGAGACIALLDFIGAGRGIGRKIFFAAVVSLSVALFESSSGLRPDLLGLCLFSIGLRLLKAETISAVFFFSLFLFLSAITSPNFTLLVPFVLLYALFFSSSAAATGSRLFYIRLGVIAVAGLLAALAFLVMIGFQLESFLVILGKAKKYATFYVPLSTYLANPWDRMKFIFNTLPLMLVAVGMPIAAGLLPSWFEKPIPRMRLLFLAMAGVIVCYVEGSSGSGIYLLALYCIVLTLYFSCRLRPYREKTGIVLLCALLVLTMLGEGRMLFQFALMPFAPPTTDIAKIRAQVEQLKPAYLFVDSAAAAELYNYRLPPNTFDCFFGVVGIWRQFPRAENMPANSVVVVSTQTARGFNYIAMTRDKSGFSFVPIPFLHAFYSQLAANPYSLYVIPVEAKPSQK